MNTRINAVSLAFAALFVALAIGHAQPAESRDTILLTLSGTVEVSPAGATAWSPGKANQALKVGDRLRTARNSRATLRLSNLSVMRVYELTTLEIQPPPAAGKNSTLDLKSGAAYFFNRDKPMETQFRTPSASGAIRGTEFNIVISESGKTELTLIDGQVDLSNDQGAIQMKSGEQATVEKGKAPEKTAVLNAVNVIQWTLYYPAILDTDELELPSDVKQTLAGSLDAYRSGDLLEALAKYPDDRTGVSEAEQVYHAALFLSVGKVTEAQDLLKDSMKEPRPAALAAALQEMIAAVTGGNSTSNAPRALTTELLAGSYMAQAHKDLNEAVKMAHAAAAKSPGCGFAQERVAELEFGFGHSEAAIVALQKAIAASPRNAQALALNGFVLCGQNKFREARAYFQRAVELDGALANGWLGRGLVSIKKGDVNAGRKDLEVAAALEPNRAFLRSYLGKAWALDLPGQYSWDQHLASKELGLAMHLDPNDPTAWLYSALLNDQRNEINQALEDLEHSEDLNNNRALFRSKFLLDKDQAVRRANLALIYEDAGFGDVAVREAGKSVEDDFANFSSHLFLSESYDALIDPKKSNLRYETPWENEMLLANLLAPIGAGALSQNISQQEYSQMFETDHLGISSQTMFLSQGAWLENASQYGQKDGVAYSLDDYFYTDPGYRPNNDFENSDYSATVKSKVTDQDTVFIRVEHSATRSGDTSQLYNDYTPGGPGIVGYDPNIRLQEVQQPNILAGYHRQWQPGSDTLLLYRYLADDYTVTDPFVVPDPNFAPDSLAYERDLVLNSIEAEHIQQTDQQRFILGARFQSESFITSDHMLQAVSSFPVQSTTIDNGLQRITGYAYYQLKPIDSLRLTVGTTYDLMRFPVGIANAPILPGDEERERLSPKAGIDWTPADRTRIRAAYTQSLGGFFNDSGTLIEPSEIAGFNQAYRTFIPNEGTVPGTQFETYGVAIDHKFPTHTYVSLEGDLLNSKSDQLLGTISGLFTPLIYQDKQVLDFKEKDLTLNVDQLLCKEVTVGASYKLIDASASYDNYIGGLPAQSGKISDESLMHEVSLFANYNLPCGFFSQFQANWWDQYNSEGISNETGDAFWELNIFGGYRFYRRHAEISLGILNLTGQDYRLNPLTYYIDPAHRRTFEASFKFNF